MLIYSQRDARWSKHPLGWGPALGTIGQYGCLDSVMAMIANDCGRPHNPATLDELFAAKRIFMRDPTGTFDLLPDRALDLAYPGSFQTVAFAGYRSDQINKAIPSKHSYVVLWISTASVLTHFVLAWSLNGSTIADPWTGHVGYLSAYGGPAAVHKTVVVTYQPPATPVATLPVPAPPVPPPPLAIPSPVVVPEPQPVPVPTVAPAYDRLDALLALLQAVLIAVGRAWKWLP